MEARLVPFGYQPDTGFESMKAWADEVILEDALHGRLSERRPSF
jgi:hypothetical protein